MLSVHSTTAGLRMSNLVHSTPKRVTAPRWNPLCSPHHQIVPERMSGWGVESKVKSFLTFAINKLNSCADSLEDEDPEDNYQELCTFTCGLSRHLKNTAAAASADLKNQIIETMLPVWDVRTDKPGENLSVDALRSTLEELFAAIAGEEPAAEEADDSDVKPENLGDMSLQDAITYMWKLDEPNRVNWGDSGFTLNMQNKGRYGTDRCEGVLFDWVNLEHPFWSSPVTKTFISLLDNYERETGKEERMTSEEKQEMAAFLDALCSTKVIKFAFEFLKAKGVDPRCGSLKQLVDFQNLISDLWMAPYRRYRKNDSSGFEHVFVGEESRGKIMGLHNWVQFYLEEKKGNIDYLGWVGKQDSDYSDDVNLVTVKFAWEDDDRDGGEVELKPMSTMLCGSTVEFEMAVLTMVFLAGNQDGDNHFTLGSERVSVKCYAQKVRYGGPKIGTAYLEIA